MAYAAYSAVHAGKAVIPVLLDRRCSGGEGSCRRGLCFGGVRARVGRRGRGGGG